MPAIFTIHQNHYNVLKTLDDLLLYSVLLKNLQGESLFDKVTENYEKALRGSSKENDGISF